MKTFDPFAYEISIRRVIEDGETLFRGTVRELPDVAVYEKSNKAAYDAVICIVKELHEQAVEQKRDFPQPFVDDEEFSGRVTLRMPRTLHQQAVTTAEAEGVSLNTLIVTVIAARVGVSLGVQRRRASDFLPNPYSPYLASFVFKRALAVVEPTVATFLSIYQSEQEKIGYEPYFQSFAQGSTGTWRRTVAFTRAVPTEDRALAANLEVLGR